MTATSEMRYMSTRGGQERLSFEEAVLAGLAPNGGLYVPCHIPVLPTHWLDTWSSLPFTDLAVEVYSLFIPSTSIPRDDLARLVQRSYASFRHPDICPLVQTRSRGEYVLELFHGPTYAFKDVALQFLGNLFEYLLARKNKGLSSTDPKRARLTVVGATSGDTGSAAIYGLRGKQDVSIFILHPKGKVSPIQEAQMTTVTDRNVFNLALRGTFDDCQDMVKVLFGDAQFNARHSLAAVNSINWARILAQMVYYFSSYFALCRQRGSPMGSVKAQYVVPTGNFGDVLAGWYALRLGLPIGARQQVGGTPPLVIATNANDILARFFQSGTYEKADSSSPTNDSSAQTQPVHGSTDGAQGGGKSSGGSVQETLSPAMDILVSSNFERLLFHLTLESVPGATVESTQHLIHQWMQSLKTAGSFSVPKAVLEATRAEFAALRVSDDETRATIRAYAEGSGLVGGRYVVDPHTAVGLTAANELRESSPSVDGVGSSLRPRPADNSTARRSCGGEGAVQVVLATAHPAKFSEAVTSSTSVASFDFERDVLPEEFRGLLTKERRVIEVATEDEVREIIARENSQMSAACGTTASV